MLTGEFCPSVTEPTFAFRLHLFILAFRGGLAADTKLMAGRKIHLVVLFSHTRPRMRVSHLYPKTASNLHKTTQIEQVEAVVSH